MKVKSRLLGAHIDEAGMPVEKPKGDLSQTPVKELSLPLNKQESVDRLTRELTPATQADADLRSAKAP